MLVGADDKNRLNQRRAAEAKCRRLCEPTELGVLRVDSEIHKMWLQKGASREKLIDAMVDCGGDKEGVEPSTVWEYHGVPLFKISL